MADFKDRLKEIRQAKELSHLPHTKKGPETLMFRGFSYVLMASKWRFVAYLATRMK